MPTIQGRSSATPYRTDLLLEQGFTSIADASREDGGQAQGPAPGELLAAALSACTCITVRMYAAHKQWPLTAVEAVVSFEQDERHVISRLERELHLHGELSPEQRLRLLKIAEQCPIHKTLAPAISITTRLAG
ncbi:OsmC family protein [Hymenobacter saemangeumensis]|uniref:OsmC family protein n=1 Tax=Hymenobacter saemangeumensis TaxID=1084522 RepID=A0ABP8I980_9BACT